MKTQTLVALAAILQSDPIRSERDRVELLKTLGVDVGAEPSDRLLTMREAGARLGRGARIVHTLARRGVLKKFCMPGGLRCAGVRASDIDKLLAGVEGGAA
jgi:hypothetical protein